MRLARALHRGTGTDCVDPNTGRKRLGGGLCEGPKSHLRKGIGHELRRQFAHALVDHVDHEAQRNRLAPRIQRGLWHLRRERLGQEHRRAQV